MFFWALQGNSMGIDVNNKKKVSFNPSHERLVNTSVDSNPKIKRVSVKGYENSILVFSIFSRRRSSDGRDGNPLIYAFKCLNNYSITKDEVLKFRPNFKKVIKKINQLKQFDCDVIVTIPSSSNVVKIVARLVGFILKKKVISDFFEKCTVYEVVSKINIDRVDYYDQNNVSGAIYTLCLKGEDLIFNIKDINNDIRHYFKPLKIKNNYNFSDKNVVIIDDVLSSGTSLISGLELIPLGYKKVVGLTLLSSL